MNLAPIAKAGGIAVLTLGLAACMDISMDIEILSETEARGTMTTSMAPDVYAMIIQMDESNEDFCEDGEVVETATSVDCIVVQEGPFAELELAEDDAGPTIEAVGNGQVRVSFPTEGIAEEVAEGAGADDPEMMAMISAMFEGNAIYISISGGEIVDTNMDRGEDGNSASYTIPFVALLSGDLDVPDELFAVVQK